MASITILSIETSARACSVSLSRDMEIVSSRMIDEQKAHASRLAPMISEVLEEASVKPSGLTAVAVSEGPGSYTGLRVGVSTAKGICFGADVPLVAVSTLKIVAQAALEQCEADGTALTENSTVVPMIDARRMEVYTCTFDKDLNVVSGTEAKVLDSSSFRDLLEKCDKVIFAGDGAEKFSAVAADPKAVFLDIVPDAVHMVKAAYEAVKKEEFKDTAYFEPHYLKDFIAGTSKKNVLGI